MVDRKLQPTRTFSLFGNETDRGGGRFFLLLCVCREKINGFLASEEHHFSNNVNAFFCHRFEVRFSLLMHYFGICFEKIVRPFYQLYRNTRQAETTFLLKLRLFRFLNFVVRNKLIFN